MEKREKVGKLSVDLATKVTKEDYNHTVEEQRNEQLSQYDKNLYECFDTNKKKYPGIFYLVVITRSDKVLTNILRHQFFTRHSCPTPQFDQCVYQCHKDWSTPKIMWVIPCEQYAQELRDNKLTVPQELWGLLRYVLDYYDGVLLKVAMKLSHEIPEKGHLILES